MLSNNTLKKIEVVDNDHGTKAISLDFSIEENRIILRGKDFSLFDRYKKLKLVGFCGEGVIEMEGVVTLSIKEQLNIEISEVEKTNDRRAYLKVRSDAKGKILWSYLPNRMKKAFHHLNDDMELRDISVGGICFFSNNVYFVKHRLYINLYEINKDLKVNTIILRKEREAPSSKYKYRYACKFTRLGGIDERIICEYAFKKELENHEKEQEKNMKIYD